ncbi:hypothetical protein ACE25B_000751 [Vibrio parahaemolyticus]|uniref:hypothetical protein n=1 Tax=Vibrio parahaemolyticus TaxID=670 RepID=UPI00084B1EA4|nr:hypothetical protein [Vibrio parahaemolyticus]OEA68638.1 hypothetical protein BBM67_19440 [Vibrio parahaemolyticus]OEA76257.1 hypothetical protein BBM68_08675 [Vibrio parahaemolyticus]
MSKGRDSNTGRFTAGNNFGGRTKGATNMFTRLMVKKLEEQGANPLQALYEISQESNDESIKVKANGKLADIITRLEDEPQPEEKHSIEQIEKRIYELLAKCNDSSNVGASTPERTIRITG